MYEVEIYEDKNGNSPVADFLEELNVKARTVKKHLHHFVKKTQKTPKREIEQAKCNWKDFEERSE